MRKLSLVLLVLLLSLSASGQQAKPAISLQISLEKDHPFCFGDSASIIGRLMNIGQASVVIDPNQIGYSVSYNTFTQSSKGNTLGSFNSVSDLGPNYKPAFVTLKASQTYSRIINLDISKDVFPRAGKYSVQIAYGQFLPARFESIEVWQGAINSNDINIFIKACKDK